MKKKLRGFIALTIAGSILGGPSIKTFAAGDIGIKNEGNAESGSSNNGSTTLLPTSNIQSKKVIITKVTKSKNVISPGEEFSLTYRVENISGGRIDGLSLKLVGVEGKNGLDGFTPVGTTNEIYVGSIAYNDVKEVTINLISNPEIKTGTYNFVTSVMYSQYGSDQEEITKLAGVVLRTIPEIVIEGLDTYPGSDGKYTLTGTLKNDTKEKIKKIALNVKVGQDTYKKEIGSIDKESDTMFEVSINPVKEEKKADIEVNYEDVSGNKYTTKTNHIVKAAVDESANENATQEKISKSNVILNFIKKLFRIGI